MKYINDLNSVISRIGSGATVVLHSGCSEPTNLASQIGRQVQHPIDLITFMPMGPSSYLTSNARVRTFFPGKGLRKAVAAGDAELLRYPLSQIPKLFNDGAIVADVLLLRLSPPDEHGKMTLGISVDYMNSVLAQKPIVVAEISPEVPRTFGSTVVLPEQIDYVFESGEGLQSMEATAASDSDRIIASNVAGLVSNGSVVQTGIGAIPDLVLGNFSHLSDLSIHTGIITDAMMPLMTKGVVTNARKSRFRGKSITTVAAGTDALYKFLHNNTDIEFYPCSVTHDRTALAAIDGLVAINSVLEVDLAGRANAERVGGRIIAGPGGLPDFATGASHAKGGKSIIALRSTTPNGDRSNIRPALDPAAPVTIDASQIDYVVTEYGVAHIRPLTGNNRASALIEIAHPDWKRELTASLHHSSVV